MPLAAQLSISERVKEAKTHSAYLKLSTYDDTPHHNESK